MIKLELECTPEQMRSIADVMSGNAIEDAIDDATKDRKCEYSGEYEEDDTGIPVSGLVQSDTTKDSNNVEDNFAFSSKVDESSESWVLPTPDKDKEPSPLSVDSVNLDSNGLPWDARIHGKAKKQNQDNTWKYIKGIDRKVWVPQIEAELQEALKAPVIPAPPAATANIPPPPPPPPPPRNVTGSTKKPAPITFQELLPKVTAARNAGTLTNEQIETACKELSLAKFGLIVTRPDLIPRMAELLGV